MSNWLGESVPLRLLVLICTVILDLQTVGVSAGVQVRVNFVAYSNPNGRDAYGHACDPGNGACDPLFTITISTPDGRFEKVTTDRASDQNYVSFGSKVVNINNPLVVQRNKYYGQVTVHVKVDDYDPIGSWDYIGTFSHTFVMTAGVNSDFRNVQQVTLRDDGLSGAQLILQMFVACLANYYSADCTRYCKPANDDSAGHYTCDLSGSKVCLPTYDPASSCLRTYCANQTPCKNSGTCSNLDSGFACSCVGLWGGSTCEARLSACDSPDTPCRNNGTCISGTGSHGCVCAAGFNGTFCQLDINECVGPQICQHATDCRNQFGTYSCQCETGWTGKNCSQDVNECESPNACFNGGTCDNAPPGNFTCRCPPGFGCLHCELDIDECAAKESPCKTGGSQVCRNLQGSFACLCSVGWSGVNCTTRYLTEAEMLAADASNNRLLVGLLVPALLLLVAAVVAFFAYRLIMRRRHQLASRNACNLNELPGRSSAISAENATYSYAAGSFKSTPEAECPYEDVDAHYAKVRSLPRDTGEDHYDNGMGRQSPPLFRAPPLPPKRMVEAAASEAAAAGAAASVSATSNGADSGRQGDGYEDMKIEPEN